MHTLDMDDAAEGLQLDELAGDMEAVALPSLHS
jgi:hypothetical protein